jgi:hypothetical protein
MILLFSNIPFFKSLCLTAVGAFGRVVDFPGENAGKNIRRMATKLGAFAAEMGPYIERAILGHTPTAIAVLGFEVIPDNPFTLTHSQPLFG